MARKMNKAPSHAWRAVIVTRSAAGGGETTEYLGPYWRRGDAQTRITTRQRALSADWSFRTFVNGWVESAPLGDWKEA
ncbi:hypothetical protein ACKI1S_27950 [Streptomyces galilaeus]|uniref:Uncharacterized protein n=1 Tax=Streptomyces galilaeus TaxID=33899 RepID=A0ABW9ISF8_STRGJ